MTLAGVNPDDHEERIGLYLDYENLAIGARENLGIDGFDFAPIATAMAERGRVLVRKAYADWSLFGDDRRHLTRQHVELIEIPQRMGASRKNAADIKLAVDAIELAFERPYITTFVIGTGDSDFTPLVHKLRELDKKVIGIGVRDSTSKLLPPACDEFLFYDRLEGVSSARRRPETEDETTPEQPIDELVTQTIAGMRSSGEPVRASVLKRAVLRKDPTFSESDHGFRGFTELLRHLADQGVLELAGSDRDPDVDLASADGAPSAAFALLARVVGDAKGKTAPMSGLKTEMRRQDAGFSERRLGYGSFLQFCRAAAARNVVTIDWDDDLGDYVLALP